MGHAQQLVETINEVAKQMRPACMHGCISVNQVLVYRVVLAQNLQSSLCRGSSYARSNGQCQEGKLCTTSTGRQAENAVHVLLHVRANMLCYVCS